MKPSPINHGPGPRSLGGKAKTPTTTATTPMRWSHFPFSVKETRYLRSVLDGYCALLAGFSGAAGYFVSTWPPNLDDPAGGMIVKRRGTLVINALHGRQEIRCTVGNSWDEKLCWLFREKIFFA